MKSRGRFLQLRASMPIALLLIVCTAYGQPRSGDWKVPTRFGQFVFTVNPSGTEITKLATTFSSYTFGGITQNGTVISMPSPGWPISNNQFNIVNSIDPRGTIKLTINGTFAPSGTQASGTWSMLVSGQSDVASWGPVVYTAVEGTASTVPEGFALEQNYPNPFNPRTTIQYSLPELSFVTLKVSSLLGEEVVTIVEAMRPAGIHRVLFDASLLVSGVYFYRLEAGGFVETKALVVLR